MHTIPRILLPRITVYEYLGMRRRPRKYIIILVVLARESEYGFTLFHIKFSVLE